eukprot:Rhum_TRINITY_DN23206_c0_g1::Rhum_TRINITY_DN23206_c0_g1_i1::g.177433::m.177433
MACQLILLHPRAQDLAVRRQRRAHAVPLLEVCVLVAQRHLTLLELRPLRPQAQLLLDQRLLLERHLAHKQRVPRALLLQRPQHLPLRVDRLRRLLLRHAAQRLALAHGLQLRSVPLVRRAARHRRLACAVELELRLPLPLARGGRDGLHLRQLPVVPRRRAVELRALCRARLHERLRRRQLRALLHLALPVLIRLEHRLPQHALELLHLLLRAVRLHLLRAQQRRRRVREAARLNRLHLRASHHRDAARHLARLRRHVVRRPHALRAQRVDLRAHVVRARLAAGQLRPRLGGLDLLLVRRRRRLYDVEACVGLPRPQRVQQHLRRVHTLPLPHADPELAAAAEQRVDERRVLLRKARELVERQHRLVRRLVPEQLVHAHRRREVDLQRPHQRGKVRHVRHPRPLRVDLLEHDADLLLPRRVLRRHRQHARRRRRHDRRGLRRRHVERHRHRRRRRRRLGGEQRSVRRRSNRGRRRHHGGGRDRADGRLGDGRSLDGGRQLGLDLAVPGSLGLEGVDLAHVDQLRARVQVAPCLECVVEKLQAVDHERCVGHRGWAPHAGLVAEDVFDALRQLAEGGACGERSLIVQLGAEQICGHEHGEHSGSPLCVCQ